MNDSSINELKDRLNEQKEIIKSLKNDNEQLKNQMNETQILVQQQQETIKSFEIENEKKKSRINENKQLIVEQESMIKSLNDDNKQLIGDNEKQKAANSEMISKLIHLEGFGRNC